MNSKRERKVPIFRKWPTLFLVALVRGYENSPGESNEPALAFSGEDLASIAGIFSNQARKSTEYEEYKQGHMLAA